MLFKTKRSGFGGKYELVLLILALSGLIYEGMFILHLYQLKKYWIIDVYLSISNKLIMHIAFVGYLTLGLLYADLNNFVSTEFKSQLESLEEQPTRRKLRKARKSLDKCLTLYKDLEVFFTHLNLYEFRVRPLGLFDISNELFLDFLSALITYLTVVIQYGMQLETFSLLLSKRLSYITN
ncbi:putative gustatory receptor 93c [Drosophila kikkawai]|uniref:Gustatory receptor 93c n=1 Tax=Drosophila kikkawai TaxID=30033 RepID=A0A6P4IHL7_DROKI|nr:putative gustatory receptor 93c [Drosophila kikkawai]